MEGGFRRILIPAQKCGVGSKIRLFEIILDQDAELCTLLYILEDHKKYLECTKRTTVDSENTPTP